MNKIKSLFKGSPIAMVAVALLVAGVASAAVVNYLSNPTTTTATVTSPIEMSVNDGRDGTTVGSDSISINTTGGSHFTFTTVAENKANTEISGYPVIVVEAPADQLFTGGEIASVWFEDKNSAGEYGVGTSPFENKAWDITNMLYVVKSDGSLTKLSAWAGNSKRLVLFFDNPSDPSNNNDYPAGTPDGVAQTYPILAGEVNWNVLTLTPNAAIAPGTYNIYSQYVADLAEYATYQYGL